MGKNTTGILWVIFLLAMINSVSISSNAISAIHQIYGGISSIVATLIFCTIIIRSTIKEESEYVSSAIRKVKDSINNNGEELENIKNIINKNDSK